MKHPGRGGRRNEAAALSGKRVGRPLQGGAAKTRTSITIDAVVLDKAREAARIQAVSVSEFIEYMLREVLNGE